MTERSRLRGILDQARRSRGVTKDVPGSDGTVKLRLEPLDDDGLERAQNAKVKTYDDRLRRAAGVIADSCAAVQMKAEAGEWETLTDGFTLDLARELGMTFDEDGRLVDDEGEPLGIVDIVLEFYDGLPGHVVALARDIMDLSTGRAPGPLG